MSLPSRSLVNSRRRPHGSQRANQQAHVRVEQSTQPGTPRHGKGAGFGGQVAGNGALNGIGAIGQMRRHVGGQLVAQFEHGARHVIQQLAVLLRRIHDWTGGKPMVLSEFYWSSPSDSGLIGGGEVRSQTERGLAYRNYVEQSAKLPYIIGIEWFTLIDQARSGRWFERYTGEKANTGLLNVADRPYRDGLAEMMKTNYDIYAVMLGEPVAPVTEPLRMLRQVEGVPECCGGITAFGHRGEIEN